LGPQVCPLIPAGIRTPGRPVRSLISKILDVVHNPVPYLTF
jgi:hypothetical protein